MTASSDLLVLVDGLLASAGMRRVIPPNLTSLWAVYEDVYAVVGVAEFESIDQLVTGWLDAQEELAGLMSASVTNIGAKAWDGYLILICLQNPIGEELAQLSEIRSNTRRTRKLLLVQDSTLAAMSKDLHGSRRQVRRALAPLMPLDIPDSSKFVDPVEELPTRLQVPGFEVEDLRILVSSYEGREPLVAKMHERLQDRIS